MRVLTTSLIIGSLETGKTEQVQRLRQVQKIFVANLLRMSKRSERLLWVRKIIR